MPPQFAYTREDFLRWLRLNHRLLLSRGPIGTAETAVRVGFDQKMVCTILQAMSFTLDSDMDHEANRCTELTVAKLEEKLNKTIMADQWNALCLKLTEGQDFGDAPDLIVF